MNKEEYQKLVQKYTPSEDKLKNESSTDNQIEK